MAVINITSNNFANLVLKSQKPSIVLFWAMSGPRIDSRNELWNTLLHTLDEEAGGEIQVCKVSVNYAPHIPMRFHIATYPTVALFRGKEILGTTSGQPTMGALKDLLSLIDAPQDAEKSENVQETTF